jgi:hypothetical protein
MGQTLTVLNNRAYAAGTFPFGPVNLPTGIESAECRIDRTALTSTTLQINWSFELSQDDGINWLSWGGAGTVGGVIQDEGGNTLTFSAFTVQLPNPTNPNRRIRGSMSLNETATLNVKVITAP